MLGLAEAVIVFEIVGTAPDLFQMSTVTVAEG